MRRVVVTGLGIVTPIGIGVEMTWQAALAGQSGVGPITLFDAQNYEIDIAAEVKNFNPLEYMSSEVYRKTDRFVQLGVAAAKMAMEDARIDEFINKNQNSIPVIIGSGLGGSLYHEEQIFKLVEGKDPRRVLSSSVPRIAPNAVSAFIAMQFKLRGQNLTISTACSSGGNAISLAARMIEDGHSGIVVTGGVECPITPFTFAAYQAMRVLARPEEGKPVPRPFDVRRDGFVLGEAGGILILEDYEQAKKRHAKIYAELIGHASNCGVYHMAAPDPSGEDAADAIAQALKSGDVKPEEIDYINAHGTATRLNDASEAKAIGKVFGFGKKGPSVSSTKSETGHTIGAAGAIEAILTILTIYKGVIPPTINCEELDPECDLNIVQNKAIERNIGVAISNSFGFGSNNSVLCFKKFSS